MKPDLFLRPKNIELFINLRDKDFGLKIYRKINCTEFWLSILINKFNRVGLIKTEKIGRRKLVYLTKKGLKLQRYLIRLRGAINETKDNP